MSPLTLLNSQSLDATTAAILRAPLAMCVAFLSSSRLDPN